MKPTTVPPLLAVVSVDIRRDLIAPMRHFHHLRLVHFYRQAPYGDLAPADRDSTLQAYRTPLDLFLRLWRCRPDIVQGVEPFAISQLPLQVAIFLYAVLRRVPLVGGVHIGRPLAVKYGRWPARLLRLLLQPSLRYTRLFFYLNEGGRRNLEWMGVPAEKTVRHMYGTWGVDPDEFTPVPDGREPEWDTEPVLLFVGRLHREKGIFDLLAAFERVQAAVPGSRLVLIGDGPHRAEAEAFVAQQTWREAIHFLGTIANRELPPYLRRATLFVSPAVTTKKWEEYVGMTNIQAMACGTPVVSTVSGAIPEYVPQGKAGLLVPERDAQALADALIALLTDEARRAEMGRFGREYAVQHYDARRNVEIAERYLRQLVAGGTGIQRETGQ